PSEVRTPSQVRGLETSGRTPITGPLHQAQAQRMPWPRVLSVSHAIWPLLLTTEAPVRCLARFRRSVDLIIGEQIVALVVPSLRNGPFHIVVERLPEPPCGGAGSVVWGRAGLQLGTWTLLLADSFVLWDPRPRWRALRLAAGSLARVTAIVNREARRLSSPFAAPAPSLAQRVVTLSAALRAASGGALREAAAGLAGWGPGLTPAGDDFLAGVMLGLWFADVDTAAWVCEQLYAGAALATTSLSRAFLRAAAAGLADERWHDFLAVLGDPDAHGLDHAVKEVVSFGASSGFDMLSGFLWLTAQRQYLSC
ncbi:MAG: DUF2877 domain-containing protein, partial [Anaerolineae bacterium]|nr:DUF2877 domain-containing protein [Anaerolineae bacterium]